MLFIVLLGRLHVRVDRQYVNIWYITLKWKHLNKVISRISKITLSIITTHYIRIQENRFQWAKNVPMKQFWPLKLYLKYSG